MSCTNYKSYLNEDCVREVNKHFVVELQQRVNLIEKNVILWTEEQFDFLSLSGKSRVGLLLYKIAYCLDANDFDIKMLSTNFTGLIENITAISNKKNTHAEHLTTQIVTLAYAAQENSEHLIDFLRERRYEYISHARMNDDEIENLILSNDNGLFTHIYGLLEEKHCLKMLIMALQVGKNTS